MKKCTVAQIITINLFFITSLFASTPKLRYLSKGSHISVENYGSDVLYSLDNSFACGFYKVATNAFIFAIWFVNSANQTIAWTANRDNPVNGHGSRIAMRKDGSLVLMDVGGLIVWSTNTSSTGAQTAQLLNSGNLVVNGSKGEVLWQSFDSPTDTLLPLQRMTRYTPLVSASAVDLLSSGYYRFYFDSNSVLTLIYDTPDITSIYWPPPYSKDGTSYNSSKSGELDELGHFTASDQLEFRTSDYPTRIKRRLTLDHDGNLRVYSLNESTRRWSISWLAISEPCEIHGTCGPNGVCVYMRSRPACSCPPGFEMNDPSNWSKGCKRMLGYNLNYDKNPKAHELKYFEVQNRDFYGFEYKRGITSVSINECKKYCNNHTFCEAFVYRSGSGECYPKSILFNGKYSGRYDTHFKFPKSADFSRLSETPRTSEPVCGTVNETQKQNVSYNYISNGGNVKWGYFYWFLSLSFALEAAFILFGWWFMSGKEHNPASVEEGFNLLSIHFRRFTYAELKRATRNFTDVVGKGGSGTVYKAVLDDHKVVAVKKLEDAIQGEDELQAELSLIGRINHKNLVRMIGFCSENSKRLLVSEFVEHGSLDKVLFDGDETNQVLKWRDRYKIALGVAHGLAYLHHECLEWVIHCDVKPENILLDKGFEPKLADFGLAKLLNRNANGSNLSRIRGTRGYIAPEWASSLPITGKVDVYSYGVVLLELVKGSRVSTWVVEGEKNVEMVFRRSLVMLRDKLKSDEEKWIDEYVDSRLNGQFKRIQVMMLLKIALSCLEEERSKRPSMNSVLQMILSYEDEYNY